MPSSDQSPDASDATADHGDLYPVVRRAVEDALWNVVGSVVYGLFLVLLGLVGVSLLVAATNGISFTVTAATALLGGGAVLGAAVGLLRLADVI
jgi:hypothetical protein